MSTHTARALGLTPRDYLRARMKMTAANGNDILLLGAALITLRRMDNDMARQMVYITASVNKLFLSLEACTDPHNFPNNESCNALPEAKPPKATRVTGCLRRQPPPPIQSTLPFPPTQANRAKLERFFIDRYAASTFKSINRSL